MIKKFKLFESRIDNEYHRIPKSNVFVNRIINSGKINGRYILNGYKNEFNDFILSIKKYNNGEITKYELKRKFISFLKLIGMSIPFITSTTLGITIILLFKKWGLERYLPDAFQGEKKI